MLDDWELENAIYGALCPELEKLEHSRNLVGNGHHVAQRITPLIRAAIRERYERKLAQASEPELRPGPGQTPGHS